jgi:hypothetical protein
MIPKWMNVVRAVSSEGFGRIEYHTAMRRMLETDRGVRAFHEGETTEIPAFYLNRIKKELGSLYDWLPEGALMHDPNAYLKSTTEASPLVSLRAQPARVRATG